MQADYSNKPSLCRALWAQGELSETARDECEGGSFPESSSNQQLSRQPLPGIAAVDEGRCETFRLKLWQLTIPLKWLHFENCIGNVELLHLFHNQLFSISLQTFTSTILMFRLGEIHYLGTNESRRLNNKSVSLSMDFVNWVCAQLNSSIKFFYFSTEILCFCRTQTLCTPTWWPVAFQVTPATMPVHKKHRNTYETNTSKTWVCTDCWTTSHTAWRASHSPSPSPAAPFSERQGCHHPPSPHLSTASATVAAFFTKLMKHQRNKIQLPKACATPNSCRYI